MPGRRPCRAYAARLRAVAAPRPYPCGTEGEEAGMGEAAVDRSGEHAARDGGGLSERDLAVLALEAEFPRHTPGKDEAIRVRLGLTATRYYRILGTLIETRAALEHDAVLVWRLRRLQQNRAARREARRAVRQHGARPDREKTA